MLGWRKRKQAPAAQTAAPARDPLAAFPLRPGHVQVKYDSEGCLHLRAYPPLKGFRKRLADWLGHDYSRKVALDKYGTIYMNMADGTHTLHEVVDRIVEASGRERKEVEQGLVLLTKKLMLLNMLCLRIPKE